MNEIQKFLFEVGAKYDSTYPDYFEEAFYILAEAVPLELFTKLTVEIEELNNG